MPYRPSARQLEYLVALSESGHFGAAARKCNVSQPTLSAQFKLLEEQLGVVLIDRSGGVAAPTPAGEAVIPLARQALSVLDDIVAMASAGVGGLGGLIRLGVAPTFGPYFMPHVLPSLKAAFPDVELYICEERPALLVPDLLNGKLDCILSPAPMVSDRLESKIFCAEEIFLGVPADHPLSELDIVPLKALKGERLLTLGQGHKLYDEARALCEVSGAEFREDYEGTSLDALRQMVSIGMGLSLFPAGYVASEFAKDERVHLKPVARFAMQRQLALAWRKGSARAAHYEILGELSRSAAKAMDVTGISAVD